MEYILEVKNLTKKIGNKKILDNISFNIERGKHIGIVGKNGAGKSTLLKSLVGLYKINGGSILINGYDLKKDYKKAIKDVGAMIDGPGLYDYMSAKDNLEGLKIMFKNIPDDRVESLLCLLSLENSKCKKLKTYSFGMKQRLGLASALINEPKLLILDEPTNGLDPVGISDLRKFLKSLEDVTIIISSHLLSEIENICDEVIFIDRGKVIAQKRLLEKSSNFLEAEFLNMVEESNND